jgi:hypothetical protein
MSNIRRALTVGALLACVSLVMSPVAAADPIAYADFLAARAAAVSASGTFTPGTTMDVDVVTGSGRELHQVTNPDGSLLWMQVEPDGLFRVRCVRVDRCWEQSDIDFDDVKWHRLPPDSVIYRQAAAGWDIVTDLDWSAASVFETGTDPDGAPTFTGRMTEEGVTLTEVVTVRPMRLTEVITMSTEGEEVVLRELTMAAQAEPVTVTPPAHRTIGAPVRRLSSWTAEINR